MKPQKAATATVIPPQQRTAPIPPPPQQRTTPIPPPPQQRTTAPPHLKELLWPPDSPPTNDPPKTDPTATAETFYSPFPSPQPITPPPAPTTTSLALVLADKTTSSALVVPSPAAPSDGAGGAFGFRKWKKNKKNTNNEKEMEKEVVDEIVSRSRLKIVVLKVALGIRVCEFVLSLVSFAVMAANTTQGWSGDSFYRYKEYRYCLSVNVIAFAYAAFQAFNLTYSMVSGKQFIKHHLCYQFDFLMDQILAYLLISASSAAATRVDEWQSNWGKDEFTEKASISTSMSFLAFVGFGLSSLISGHNLCNRDFT